MTDVEPPPGGDPNLVEDLSSGVLEAARALFSAGDITTTFVRIVDSAVETIEGCDTAGVYLFEGDELHSPASSDYLSAHLDAIQKELGEGPCLDAMSQRTAIYADDLAESTQWPAFGAAALEAGVRSALSMCLSADGTVGALNCYGLYPRAFGATDRAKAVVLASLAGLALANAQIREADDARAANLEAALSSREIIGQAQGILMERERLSADQAFDILRRASQHLNVKLRDVAQRLVDTGEIPPR
jgi:GAF domain-containing protein